MREYMEVIKAQMQKEEVPPVAPHAPAHGLQQPIALISNNNGIDKKGPRPPTKNPNVLRHSGLVAPS